jgi:hypothetical protein
MIKMIIEPLITLLFINVNRIKDAIMATTNDTKYTPPIGAQLETKLVVSIYPKLNQGKPVSKYPLMISNSVQREGAMKRSESHSLRIFL